MAAQLLCRHTDKHGLAAYKKLYIDCIIYKKYLKSCEFHGIVYMCSFV